MIKYSILNNPPSKLIQEQSVGLLCDLIGGNELSNRERFFFFGNFETVKWPLLRVHSPEIKKCAV